MPTRQPELTARVITDDPRDTCTTPSASPRSPWRRRGLRAVSLSVTALLLGFLAVMGLGGTSQPAEAELICLFDQDSPPPPEGAAAGIGAMIQEKFGDNEPFGEKRQTTAYEQYRTAGAYWSVYFPEDEGDSADGATGCKKISATVTNELANEVFNATKVVTALSISMYQWASDPDLLDSFDEPMTCLVTGCQGQPGLKQALYLNFLQPIIVLGALWAGWKGLVKKRTTEAAQGGLWMICAAGFALMFMSYPALVASTANGVVSRVNSTVMEAITSTTAVGNGEQDICYLNLDSVSAGKRKASCAIYKALVFTPWSAGQFGVPIGDKLPVTQDKDLAAEWGGRTLNDLRIMQIEAQAVNHDEGIAGLTNGYDSIAEEDAERWESVREQMRDNPGFATWAGDRGGERINIAFASLIATCAAGLLVLLISFSTVVMAIGMILLIMMAPLFLLIGAHPGFGRGIALKWLELLLGTVVKRIVLGFMLAVLIGMYQIILAVPMSWFSQIALIVAVGVGAIMFRKPMLDTMNVVNLGGSRTGMENSDLARQGKKGAAMGLGGVSGAVSAGKSGGMGAILGGAVAGGMMGMRSGNPTRAAMMGSGAGRRVGGRKRVESERAEREAEKQKEAAEKAQKGAGGAGGPDANSDDDNSDWENPAPGGGAGGAGPRPADPGGPGPQGPAGGGNGGAGPRPNEPAPAGASDDTLVDGDWDVRPPVVPAPAAPAGSGVATAAAGSQGAGNGGAGPRPGAPAASASAGVPVAPPSLAAPSGASAAPSAGHVPVSPRPAEVNRVLDNIVDALDGHQRQMESMARGLDGVGTDVASAIQTTADTKESLGRQIDEVRKSAGVPTTAPKPMGGSARGGSTSGSTGGSGGTGPRPGGN